MHDITNSSDLEASWLSWLGESVSESRLVSRSLGVGGISGVARHFFQNLPSENAVGHSYLEAPIDSAFHRLAEKWGVKPEPFWPGGAPYALAVTHDMDRLLSSIQRAKQLRRHPVQLLRAMIKDIPSCLRASQWKTNPFYNFDRIIKLQDELNFRSAIYVLFEKRRLARAITRNEWQHVIGVYDPAWIKDDLLAFRRAGNEIGIHGSFDSYCRDQVLIAEKAKLEEWTGAPILGVRNHYLQYDPVLSARAQKLTGLLYDSTMGFNFSNGFRAGTCFPYRRHGVWELPFQLMDSALRFQFEGMSQRVAGVDGIQRTVRQMGGVLVANWHTHVLNADCYPEEIKLLARIVTTAKSDGAWIARPQDIILHWQRRSESSGELLYSPVGRDRTRAG